MTNTNTASGAAELATRLRNACASVRTKSYPLADLIPLMQQAADALAAAPQPSTTPQADPLQPIVGLQEQAGMYVDDFATQADSQPVMLNQEAARVMLKEMDMNDRVLAAIDAETVNQADSVTEDTARLDWLALAGPTSICVVVDRRHDGEVEVATDDVTGYGKTLREAMDAARKQGATP